MSIHKYLRVLVNGDANLSKAQISLHFPHLRRYKIAYNSGNGDTSCIAVRATLKGGTAFNVALTSHLK